VEDTLGILLWQTSQEMIELFKITGLFLYLVVFALSDRQKLIGLVIAFKTFPKARFA
jgi:hypothetical protein